MLGVVFFYVYCPVCGLFEYVWECFCEVLFDGLVLSVIVSFSWAMVSWWLVSFMFFAFMYRISIPRYDSVIVCWVSSFFMFIVQSVGCLNMCGSVSVRYCLMVSSPLYLAFSSIASFSWAIISLMLQEKNKDNQLYQFDPMNQQEILQILPIS